MRLAMVSLLLLGAWALAQEVKQPAPEPEPGPVPDEVATVGRLVVPPVDGDVKTALATFLEAHAVHKSGDADVALAGYLAFLGMPGRHELPQRYVETARRRIDVLVDAVRARFEEAVALYRKDREKGVTALEAFSSTYAQLPHGRAALRLWHSDRLRLAIDTARAAPPEKNRAATAKTLESAILSLPEAQYAYEAKKLLIELGGRDLLEPDERVKEKRGADGAEDADEEPEEAPVIEINDD
jgi:hypothetical protein